MELYDDSMMEHYDESIKQYTTQKHKNNTEIIREGSVLILIPKEHIGDL